MSMTFKAKNNKSQEISIGNVRVGSFVEVILYVKNAVGEIVDSNLVNTTVRDLCNYRIMTIPNDTLCYIIENIEINYKYEHRQYTDKERLDFLNEYGIDSLIECKKDSFIYKSEIDNTSGLRKTIDRIMEYFENK